MEKKMIFELSVKELVEILKKELMNDTVGNDVMSRLEASDYLKITPMTLWNWTNQGKVNTHKIGGKLYYRKSELDALLGIK